MATKWRGKRIILLFCMVMTIGFSSLLSFYSYSQLLLTKNYFESQSFQSYVGEWSQYIAFTELSGITEEEVKEKIVVTEEEILEHRYRYGSLSEQLINIKGQYEDRIEEAAAMGDEALVKVLTEERDTKLEDIQLNFESDEHVEAKIRKEKEQAIESYFEEKEYDYENFLPYKDSFVYYFESNKTGEVYTNLPNNEEIKAETMHYIKEMKMTSDEFHFYDDLGIESPSPTEVFVGKIGVPKSLSSSNELMEQYEQEQMLRTGLFAYTIFSFCWLFIGFFMLWKSKTVRGAINSWSVGYEKLPIDVRIVAFIGMSIVAFVLSLLVKPYMIPLRMEGIVAFVGASVLWAFTFVQFILLLKSTSINNLSKQWQNAIMYKIAKWGVRVLLQLKDAFRNAFLNWKTGTQMLLLLGAIYALGVLLGMAFISPFHLLFYLILIGVVGIPVVKVLMTQVGYLNKIAEKTEALANGQKGKELSIEGQSIFASIARHIAALEEAVKKSQKVQAKSERLKTELITNVSHDLRTPLTSVITYTELLKKEGLSEEERAAYVEIIDRKSKRLKVLIDDLFEVSKMTSGNIELTKERVDLNQLLHQSLAEYDEWINESNLQFRIKTAEKPVYAYVDGQKLWRVFDNLIGNILKYSLEHSRVYIQLQQVENQAMMTFKNVSKYELSENLDELLERFKRGDESRHTEGSGLGLAIAKSIIDLHEGQLDIEMDGDLFKVVVVLNSVE